MTKANPRQGHISYLFLDLARLKDLDACAEGLKVFKKVFGGRKSIRWSPEIELKMRCNEETDFCVDFLVEEGLIRPFSLENSDFSDVPIISSERSFDGINFTNSNFRSTLFCSSGFTDCILNGSDFTKVRLEDCRITSSSLNTLSADNMILRDGKIRQCSMVGCIINYARISYTQFMDCNLQSLIGKEVILDHVSFLDCDMKNIKLQQCKIIKTDFVNCDLRHAVLEDLDLNTEHVTFKHCTFNKYTVFPDGYQVPENSGCRFI